MSVADFLHWLSDTTLAVSALIFFVLIIRKPFARAFGANATYALWLLPAIRLAMPQLNVLPRPDASVVANATEILSYSVAPSVSATVASMEANSPDMAAFAGAFVVTLWILVALAIVCYAIERHIRAMKAALAASSSAEAETAAMAQRLAQQFGLHRPPRIRVIRDISGPSVIGVFRPVILLPANFTEAYAEDEQRLALAHEIAHIVRGDLVSGAIASIVTALQWPNPLVHMAMRAFRVDQEAACDETVLSRRNAPSDKGAYISAIIKSINGPSANRAPGLTLNHPIKERLMYLKNETKNKERRFLGHGVAAVTIVAGVLGAASYGYADEKEIDVKEEVKEEHRVMIIKGDGDEEFDFSMLGEDGDFEFISEDGDHKKFKVIRSHGGELHEDGMVKATCSSDDSEPVKLEWTDESEAGDHKYVEKRVICLTGDDAKPENRIAALERAIAKMEEDAKRQEERRKRMIKGLREQLKEMEAEQ